MFCNFWKINREYFWGHNLIFSNYKKKMYNKWSNIGKDNKWSMKRWQRALMGIYKKSRPITNNCQNIFNSKLKICNSKILYFYLFFLGKNISRNCSKFTLKRTCGERLTFTFHFSFFLCFVICNFEHFLFSYNYEKPLCLWLSGWDLELIEYSRRF